MTNKDQNLQYDLTERTAHFGEMVLQFAKKIQQNPINEPLITQLVKAATSIGANYCEAEDAVSKRDFRNKIGICRKESKETMHWFRMIGSANANLKIEARELYKEARELNLIFSKIFRSSKE
ncbi:MAG: four helix bundle protein [Phycisphaerae bacterium SM23_30]|nr:MAG: four helix bundle protein [Phycisphaerae bacterium SM23_30]